jgi:hypothetical protein
MIDAKDAPIRDDPALVIDRHNAIIRATSSIGTKYSSSGGALRVGYLPNAPT